MFIQNEADVDEAMEGLEDLTSDSNQSVRAIAKLLESEKVRFSYLGIGVRHVTSCCLTLDCRDDL